MLLVCDVWEHAYYLQYRHSRIEWLSAFWNIVNWADVESRLVATSLRDPRLVAFDD
jgi:Fe-Mn family superoxide dismutase